MQRGANAAQTPEGVMVTIKKGSIDQEQVTDVYRPLLFRVR